MSTAPGMRGRGDNRGETVGDLERKLAIREKELRHKSAAAEVSMAFIAFLPGLPLHDHPAPSRLELDELRKMRTELSVAKEEQEAARANVLKVHRKRRERREREQQRVVYGGRTGATEDRIGGVEGEGDMDREGSADSLGPSHSCGSLYSDEGGMEDSGERGDSYGSTGSGGYSREDSGYSRTGSEYSREDSGYSMSYEGSNYEGAGVATDPPQEGERERQTRQRGMHKAVSSPYLRDEEEEGSDLSDND
ncbi:hypothetical protein KIPB_007554 [Kipferlia bialata]|uniref:Uncharacterized protein n=1 Tax=Kipferlia bialata TaxID=797122 RepID=A0A9K3D076_9EUKA|nr:hypothetical protein KIPB_007554 [Kipferlia bialata]|eukprot:g7554.t1